MTLDFAPPYLLAAIALLGLLLSPVTEILVARFLPRLGGLPSTGIRMTTAAITGLLFALLTLRFGPGPELPAFLFLALLAVQLSRIDFTHHLLPNPLVLALLSAGFAMLVGAAATAPDWPGLLRAAAGGAASFAVYLILGLISPRGIGMGDVKLAAPLGVYLGYLGWGQVFYGMMLGFVMGGALTVLMLRLRSAEKPAETAHGPAMFAAALGVVLLLS
ncbi:prepilin peptidase [Arthrobacter sp. CJ23]|uniref:prepilin peptidase n=1 Tax=Arthrobacter sp. CJ23 TaxID=2972479 RepID=UPI00215C6351|nr:prepilin peptidase [Arthrobacter sp. CJ23]UVJ38522.1 prepilin peptidase [Arthrobacter sp. CJ23]